MKIKNAGFRSIYHQIVFIESKDMVSEMKDCFKTLDAFEINDDSNGILAYGYVDSTAGFTFEVLCAAYKNGEQFSYNRGNDKIRFIIRMRDFENAEVFVIEKNDYFRAVFEEFKIKTAMIDKSYKGNNLNIEKMRGIKELDGSRHLIYPDDILTYLVKQGIESERVWLRCCDMGENCLKGVLLNEPYQDFNFHAGDILNFIIVKDDDNFLCVSEL